ncbi:MAG: hypothetical protein IPK79_00010 [Vampirovibrionales bacterium]|nr:hypothetical protein [Vampirovibrionales bacterium]
MPPHAHIREAAVDVDLLEHQPVIGGEQRTLHGWRVLEIDRHRAADGRRHREGFRHNAETLAPKLLAAIYPGFVCHEHAYAQFIRLNRTDGQCVPTIDAGHFVDLPACDRRDRVGEILIAQRRAVEEIDAPASRFNSQNIRRFDGADVDGSRRQLTQRQIAFRRRFQQLTRRRRAVAVGCYGVRMSCANHFAATGSRNACRRA